MSGDITLEEKETIKLVGHSMGAAFAAGMAKAILENKDYRNRLEIVDYIAPFQPGDFSHPEEVFGRQFSSKNDRFSGKGEIRIKGVQVFEVADLSGKRLEFGGHIGPQLNNWLSKMVGAGIPVFVVQ